MTDDLRRVPTLLELARKTRAVVSQNIGISLLLAVVGLALAATGRIEVWLALFLYAVGYVAVIFNSLRLVRFGEDITEQEQAEQRLEAARPVKPVRTATQQAAARAARAPVPAR